MHGIQTCRVATGGYDIRGDLGMSTPAHTRLRADRLHVSSYECRPLAVKHHNEFGILTIYSSQLGGKWKVMTTGKQNPG